MVAPKVFDHFGRSVGLGPLIRRGGEGAVFNVADQPALVAKLYEKAPGQDKADKLRSMIAVGSADLTRIAAWPVKTLHDRPNGQLCGFVMPKIIGHKEVHKLYGPAHRQREFPDADWAFLVHTAANCAAAFEAIHALKHLMGDVNPGNVLVSAQSLVALIDCDSFQVQSNGRTFRCEVGVPEYTPPELQGVVFRDVSRIENHDRFGLAVLIFHLLFMGRHPFAGRYRGPGDMSLDRAIRECRFPFSLRANARKEMEPPPLAPTVDIVTAEIANLFDCAFHDAGRSARPSAVEWHAALSNLERQLVACQREPVHKYARHLSVCPWCRFEDGTPSVLFFVSQTGGLDFLCSTADLAPILAEFERIPWPRNAVPQGASPITVHPVPVPLATVTDLKRVKIAQALLAVFGLVVLTGLIVLVFMPVGLPVSVVGVVVAVVSGVYWLFLARRSQFGKERQRRQLALKQAQVTQEQWSTEWQNVSGRSARIYSETRSRIDMLRKDYGQLKQEFDVDIAKLEQSKEAAQRRDYLRNEFIEEAVIKGIGSNVKNALLSEGIETVLDVLTRSLDGIPGIGERRRATLTGWAEDFARTFQFDPKKDVPVGDRRPIVAKYHQRQVQIKGQLERQVAEFRQLAQRSAVDIEKARNGLTAATAHLAQAQADWTAVE
jgi:DNA-binding helix-hairpin-helix protein with protein kinase domain